jgi:hypothetical protein
MTEFVKQNRGEQTESNQEAEAPVHAAIRHSLYPHSQRAVVLPMFQGDWIAPAGISSSSPTFGW